MTALMTNTGVPCPDCWANLTAFVEPQERPLNPLDGPVITTIKVRVVACSECGFREEYEPS